MDLLPGEITDPAWTGPRCMECGRPIGGDGSMMGSCVDMPQAHYTTDSIPERVKVKFFTEAVWNNALSEMPLLEAIKWMTTGTPDPVDRIIAGDGMAVLEEQFKQWPQRKVVWDRMRKMRKVA